MLYKYFLRPILFLFSPEVVHYFFVWFGEILGRFAPGRFLSSFFYGYHGRDISKVVDGIRYKLPIILAAGFDYNGRLTEILPEVSFGGVEVGSVTARPCSGNSGKTLTRLIKTESIIVNKGLKNDGVDEVIKRLKFKKKKSGFVVGVNIAKTNDEVSADSTSAIADYFESFKKLNESRVGDYYAINISCPNAYGGETFTTPALLEKLILKLSEIKCEKPVYVKMPINLPWADFSALLDVLDKSFVNGVIIGNLNKDYSYIKNGDTVPNKYMGGLSGAPCRELSDGLIKNTREKYGKRFTIIGVGGIMSSEDALTKFRLGADLVGLITGMIYEGPGLMKKIAKAYSLSNL